MRQACQQTNHTRGDSQTTTDQKKREKREKNGAKTKRHYNNKICFNEITIIE